MILSALSLVVLLGCVGLAVDVGSLYRAKRIMQTAADSGAIAGVSELQYGTATAAAKADAALNGVTDGATGTMVTVNSPALQGPHAGTAGYVEVIASKSQPLFFMGILNHTSATVTARAVAGRGRNQYCVYTLGTSGTDFLINGSANLTVQSCGIVDDSSSNQAMLLNGTITLSAKSIGIVGNYTANGSVTVSPTPISGIAPASDPLGYLAAPSFSTGSCLANPNLNGSGSSTLGPAISGGIVCYNGLTINGSMSVTLNPGVYIINGAFILNGSGSLSGTGVTLYFPSGSSYLDNGSETLNLTAPTSGTYDGILFYQDPSNTRTMTFNGSGSSSIKGIFYAPSANLILNGSLTSTLYASFVVGSLTFNGSGTLQDYSVINSSSPLTSVSLAE